MRTQTARAEKKYTKKRWEKKCDAQLKLILAYIYINIRVFILRGEQNRVKFGQANMQYV